MVESVNLTAWRKRHFGEFHADCARYLEVSRAWLWLLERGWVRVSLRIEWAMQAQEADPTPEALEAMLERLRRGKPGS